MDIEVAIELTSAIYEAMDAGADETDIRDMVEQAIDTWVPKDQEA